MANLPLTEVRRRLKAVRAAMRREGLDGLLAVDPFNVRYLSGYTGEGVRLLIGGRSAWLVAGHRNVQRSGEQTVGYTIVDLQRRKGFLKRWAQKHAGGAVGIEGRVGHAVFVQHRKAMRPARLKVSDAVRSCRAIKTPGELALLRRAQRETEKVFERILGELRPGLTEKQVHCRILEMIAGNVELDGPAFSPIVASGPSAWGTHSYYTDRKIRKNDCVIFDLGVKYRGYCADMTRTVFLGRPTAKMRDVYAMVLEAQQRAIDAIAPGVRGCDVDAAARGVIRERGYGDSFGHGLGHGVGLEIHEAPVPGLSAANKRPLEEGMVLTVEPGSYFQDGFGVRIEDTVVVCRRGCENLMKADKALTVVG